MIEDEFSFEILYMMGYTNEQIISSIIESDYLGVCNVVARKEGSVYIDELIIKTKGVEKEVYEFIDRFTDSLFKK